MKYFYFLLLFSNFCIVKAQLPIDELVNNNWYLTNFESETLNPHFNYLESDEYNEVTLSFEMIEGILHYKTTVCATKEGMVSEIFEEGESMVIFENNIINGEACVHPDFNQFESTYFSDIYEGSNWLNIEEQSDGSLQLSFSTQTFSGASFSNQSLSSNEISRNKISISPNPVKNNLTIENPDLKIDTIQIIDASGKAWIHQAISERKIQLDLGSLPKGIYFVHFESSGKTIQTEKILKN